jgi:hypothetical protein
MPSPASLREIKSFGGVAAEEDNVLDYFLTTDSVQKISSGDEFLVIGRKGSGKTALVRYFSEEKADQISVSLSLNSYPWNIHATRRDAGASDIECYVASWYLLIAIQFASLVLRKSTSGLTLKDARAIKRFLDENYGSANVKLDEVLRLGDIKLSSASFEPELFGCKLGHFSWERSQAATLGIEALALAEAIAEAAVRLAMHNRLDGVLLHFDELDHGLSRLDEAREMMLVGLILAVRKFRRFVQSKELFVKPVIYLRTDIWDDLAFSDKNKITSNFLIRLEWNRENLRHLVDLRIGKQLGGDFTWSDIASSSLMRGSQQKWDHIIARTFLRPRDVIFFLNAALDEAKRRSEVPLIFENSDILAARQSYSSYLKAELDDEIGPHWSLWTEALNACGQIGNITVRRGELSEIYSSMRSKKNEVDVDEALALLYRFSVLGYKKGRGGGGSEWIFHYQNPQLGWDNQAKELKVHIGLKEYAGLREERKLT